MKQWIMYYTSIDKDNANKAYRESIQTVEFKNPSNKQTLKKKKKNQGTKNKNKQNKPSNDDIQCMNFIDKML